jgi:hypothetical protein
MKTCSIPNCGRPFIARGYCHTHWKRWKTYGDARREPYANAANRLPCSVDGCESLTRIFGLCNRHAIRLKHHGDTSVNLKANHDGYLNGHYLMTGGKKNRRLVHRTIWEKHHGSIPEGFFIHHKNHISTDNRIENLMIMSPAEHSRYHAKLQKLPRGSNGQFLKSRSVG